MVAKSGDNTIPLPFNGKCSDMQHATSPRYDIKYNIIYDIDHST